MWPLSCFRLPKRSIRKPGEGAKSGRARRLENADTTDVGIANHREVLPVLEVSTLRAEWDESAFPVAGVSINVSEGSSASSPRLDVLWHNADNVDFWVKLVLEAANSCLMDIMTSMLRNGYPVTQVVNIPGTSFANNLPGSPAAYPYTNIQSAVPVSISIVRLKDQFGGTVARVAFLLVCRAPLMPHRRLPAQQRKYDASLVFQNPLSGHGPQPSGHRPTSPAARAPQQPTAAAAAGFAPCPVPISSPRNGMYGNGGVNGGFTLQNTTAQRQLDSMVAAHLPAIITVFTLDGQVLHQNPASVAYMGALPTPQPAAGPAGASAGSHRGQAGGGTGGAAAYAGPLENGVAGLSCTREGGAAGGDEDEEQQLVSGLGVLGQIFRYEQAKARHMLEVLSGAGAVWQGIVRVPPSAHLRRSLATREEVDTAWGAGAGGGSGAGSGPGSGGGSGAGSGGDPRPRYIREAGWESGALEGCSMSGAVARGPHGPDQGLVSRSPSSNQHGGEPSTTAMGDSCMGVVQVLWGRQGSRQEVSLLAGMQPGSDRQVRKSPPPSSRPPSSSSHSQQLQMQPRSNCYEPHQRQQQQPSTLLQHAYPPPDHLQQSQQQEQTPQSPQQEQQQATDPHPQNSCVDPQILALQPHQLTTATSHPPGPSPSRPTSFPRASPGLLRRAHTIAQQQIPGFFAHDSRGGGVGGIRGGGGEDAASPVVRAGSESTPFTTSAVLDVVAGASSHGQGYDAEIDPLATSTWTVIADRHTRGWPQPTFRSFAAPSRTQPQTATSQPYSHSQALPRPPHLTAGTNTIDITALSGVRVGDESRGGDSYDKAMPPLAVNSMGLVELTTRLWGTGSGVQEAQDEGCRLPSLIVGSHEPSDLHPEMEITGADIREGDQGRGVEDRREAEGGRAVGMVLVSSETRPVELEGSRAGWMGGGGGVGRGKVGEGGRDGGGRGSGTSGGCDGGMHNNYHHNHHNHMPSLMDTRSSGTTPQLSTLSTTTATAANMSHNSMTCHSSNRPHSATATNHAAGGMSITGPLPPSNSNNPQITHTINITSNPGAGASRVLLFASSLRSAPFNPGLVRRPSHDHLPMLLSARDPCTTANGTTATPATTTTTNRPLLSQRLPASRAHHQVPQQPTTVGTNGPFTEHGTPFASSSSPAPSPVTVRGFMRAMAEPPHGTSGVAPTEDIPTDTALTTTASSTIPGRPSSGPATRSVSWRLGQAAPTPPTQHHGDIQQLEHALTEEATGPREGPSSATGPGGEEADHQQQPQVGSAKCQSAREQSNAALLALLRARGSTLVVARPQLEETAHAAGGTGGPQSAAAAAAPNGTAAAQSGGGGGGEMASSPGALAVLGQLTGRSRGRISGGEERSASRVMERRAGGGEGEEGGGGEVSYDTWHEMSAVSAVDPVTGVPVLVVTQIDVSAKVRAERHLVHVMCAERRLLLQLFPRHVLQHVIEANPLLHSSAPSLESLPREWLEGGDWRPVLRDADKLATMHPKATVLFADIAGFDDLCMELPPQQVMAFLNDLVAKFDNSIEPFGVHKMETIGGLFIVAGGLLREEADGAVAVRERWDPLHAEKVFMFAKAMLNVAAKTRLPTLQEPVKLRIGIHTGPVMSGIVGTRVPRFVLFGDTVNTASRMQTTATPGTVHASEDTRALLPHESWTSTGGVQIKGKGLLHTYVWTPEDTLQFLVPPATTTTTADSSNPATATATGNGSGCTNPTPTATNPGGPVPSPSFALNTIDTSSVTSSDVFLAQQLSFTNAIAPSVNRIKSRLRNEGGYL